MPPFPVYGPGMQPQPNAEEARIVPASGNIHTLLFQLESWSREQDWKIQMVDDWKWSRVREVEAWVTFDFKIGSEVAPGTLSVPMSLNSIFLIFTTYATHWKCFCYVLKEKLRQFTLSQSGVCALSRLLTPRISSEGGVWEWWDKITLTEQDPKSQYTGNSSWALPSGAKSSKPVSLSWDGPAHEFLYPSSIFDLIKAD